MGGRPPGVRLRLEREAKLVELVEPLAGAPGRRLEASGVLAKDDGFCVIFDNLPDIVRLAPVFDAGTMTYPWRHADPEVDRLHALVAGIAGDRGSDSRGETFDRIWRPAHAAAGLTPPARARVIPSPAPIAYMSEPWYCCAEPTPAQEALI